ncbi:uncharacterized protein BDW43DRAFT_242758 [Aspergillus alliaceus]|uniref:uncharacterized protein n=1 Tax=Petromyces alliaceus TaxID=209559 RepID=UPI0012A66558|nr:uncharacterized protein BDW43DRAFT_242758 [Aspergillus alliaceus]KAB8227620.1 hypothetical protein BDW43DRAFT_242758 [Aspergillus alliaceus]
MVFVRAALARSSEDLNLPMKCRGGGRSCIILLIVVRLDVLELLGQSEIFLYWLAEPSCLRPRPCDHPLLANFCLSSFLFLLLCNYTPRIFPTNKQQTLCYIDFILAKLVVSNNVYWQSENQ